MEKIENSANRSYGTPSQKLFAKSEMNLLWCPLHNSFVFCCFEGYDCACEIACRARKRRENAV